MPDYIERKLAKQVLLSHEYSPTEYDLGEVIDSIPAADVVEVRHGRWEWGYQNGQYGIWCTGCGAGWVDSENAEWIAHEHDYCPKCGAKMDGKGEGE